MRKLLLLLGLFLTLSLSGQVLPGVVGSQGITASPDPYGIELVTGGDFASVGSWWIRDGITSITGGEAQINETDIYRTDLFSGSLGIIAGQIYKIEFDITNYVSGTAKVTLGNTDYLMPATTINATGHYSYELTAAVGAPDRVNVEVMGVASIYHIDNISVKKKL